MIAFEEFSKEFHRGKSKSLSKNYLTSIKKIIQYKTPRAQCHNLSALRDKNSTENAEVAALRYKTENLAIQILFFKTTFAKCQLFLLMSF